MNRIILIGNGFDLAHGLKTGYKDFLKSIFNEEKILEEIKKDFNAYQKKQKKYPHFSIDNTSFFTKKNENFKSFTDKVFAYFKQSKIRYQPLIIFHNKFLELILSKNSENWVDIEATYYSELKKCFGSDNKQQSKIEKLNIEFKEIEDLLSKYLLDLLRTFSFKKNNVINNILHNSEVKLNNFSSKILDLLVDVQYEIDFSESEGYQKTFIDKRGIRKKIIKEGFKSTEEGDLLILNFNYTDIIKSYFSDGKINLINIHGTLTDNNNPIIFGYGDEMDPKFKEIEHEGSEDFLKNVKSINYLNTSNYQKFETFIERDLYQVIILGHSCGLSDRILLNKIFEHDNCISIKPYYYKNEDKETDNYFSIVSNIYRCFNDKQLMRSKVVNKENTEAFSVKKTSNEE
ncbi:AbiH family protein [Flammeovirga kamogawensis]|uniref:Bacteriophage abortive infection AbiH family protein n=1 Tax=Flammeovirga kamogawensis TaxID=373891 RepID=A0ABX8GZG9_9BACT|nr:AbiH family protein [Flammeovirga kamogawensis]MBB6459225.1 hypothetical protein [Flammeovirga kamogawensis]QWG08789.1 bacteriophage abortive infection AbiH family protein [Flammeovirga kamogawensis]TRX67079.1 hypothetical protein EO216_02605 [Flammeovirga kamogawensis]